MHLFLFVFVTARSYFRRVLLSGGSLALQGQRRQDILLWKGEKVSFIPHMFFLTLFRPVFFVSFCFVFFCVWHYVNARVSMSVGPLLLGTLRNYDGDGNGNIIKSNRFNEQNNNSARASCFFVNFFAVLARLWQWHGQILSLPENGNGKAINSTISVWTRARVPSLQFQKFLSFLFNMAIWDNFQIVSKDKKPIFCDVFMNVAAVRS